MQTESLYPQAFWTTSTNNLMKWMIELPTFKVNMKPTKPREIKKAWLRVKLIKTTQSFFLQGLN